MDVDTNMALVPTIAGGFGFDTNSGVNGAVVAAVESTPYGNALKITCDGSQCEMPGELWICVMGTSTNTFTVQIGQ